MVGMDGLGPSLQAWTPYRNALAGDIPNSYTFRGMGFHGGGAELSLAKGHLNRWHQTPTNGKNGVTGIFESPIESNGFWFPTSIQLDVPDLKQKYHIQLARVNVRTEGAK
jgi:hypothetical protein